jgi:hypothetical protein
MDKIKNAITKFYPKKYKNSPTKIAQGFSPKNIQKGPQK